MSRLSSSSWAIYCKYLLLLGVCLASGAVIAAEGEISGAAEKGGITFEVGARLRRIPSTFFGVHDSRLYGVGRQKDHTSPELTELIRDLGFGIIRGPDGTGANYYLWREGRPLNSKDSRYEQFYGKKPVGMLERINLQPGYPPLLLADIYKPASELGLPYLFALNVSSQSVEEIAAQVSEMRKLTKFPVRIELGNELYAILNEVAFPRVVDYISKSRQIREALQKIDPTIQVGIVGIGADLEGRILGDVAQSTVDPSVDMETTQRGRVLAWNKALRESPAIYDAVTVHISPPVNGPLDKFTVDSLMQYLFAFNESSAVKLKVQAASFPGKEIWVSEWGFLPMAMLEEEGAKRDRAQFLKTPGMAIARGDRLLSMSQISGVTITSYHDLLGGNGFGVAQKESKDGQSSLVKLPTYHVFKAIGALLKENDYSYAVSASQCPVESVKVRYTTTTVSMPLVSVYGFGDEKDIKRVVFVNRSRASRTVQVKDALLKPEWIYGGGDPLPDFQNYPGRFIDPPKVNPAPEHPTVTWSDEVALAPYSMTICNLTRKSKSPVK